MHPPPTVEQDVTVLQRGLPWQARVHGVALTTTARAGVGHIAGQPLAQVALHIRAAAVRRRQLGGDDGHHGGGFVRRRLDYGDGHHGGGFVRRRLDDGDGHHGGGLERAAVGHEAGQLLLALVELRIRDAVVVYRT